MKYISTRGEAPDLSFEEAMLTGLARDGGLYVPSEIPPMSHDDIEALAGLSYEEIAFRVMKPFIGDTFEDDEFRSLISMAYAGFNHSARAPLVQVGSNEFLLELFHGPTLAFKDFAMQLIGQMFQAVLARQDKRVTIVGATSGDTGSAAIEAFGGLENVDVFIMYPHGKVSEVQRRQMTTPTADNVHALAMDGDFDDCQARLKDMFNDHTFRDDVQLAGVNSINWARVLAQVVYYFSSAVSLGAPHKSVDFVVPTGNFGDIFAGYIAKRMGLTINRLVIATNQNDILHRTVANNDHTKAGVKPSASPSMDIQVSSNFERLVFDLHDQEPGPVRELMHDLNERGGYRLSDNAITRLRENFDSAACDEPATTATIRATFGETGEIVCPHTATGLFAQATVLAGGSCPSVILATAHPAKFPTAVEVATGHRPSLPDKMADLFDRPERVVRVPNDLAVLEGLIREKRCS